MEPDHIVRSKVASLRDVCNDNDCLRARVKRIDKAREQVQGQYNLLQGQQQQLKDTSVSLRSDLANERDKTARLESRCDEQTDVVRGLRAALKDALLAAEEAVPKEATAT